MSNAECRGMKVLENSRHICDECGHIVFPGDSVLLAPVSKMS
jgi:hypothetical protein